MSIWLKTLLLFVVFNEVQLYRQLKNSTCLELAKPSNHQFRLPCNNTSYHCLLDENYTKEYEICKMWIWIPEEKCAYLNTYRGNIDARSCLSSAQMDCPKKQYRSENNIMYAACYVKKNPIINRPTARNTSCLELTRPSNKVFRLSCNDASKYHCLLDENYTQEYEVCRMWKWIPEGKCAYFNTNSGGNIDVRNCTSSPQFVCPKKRYRSEDIMQYDACFVTNIQSTITQTPSLNQTGLNWTSNDNGGNATISLVLKSSIIRNVLPIIMGIIVPSVTIAVLYFIFMHLKYVRLYKTGKDIGSLNDDKNVEQQLFLENEMENTPENTSTMKHNNEYRLQEARKEGTDIGSLNDDKNEEQQLFLGNDMKNTPENTSTMKHNNEYRLKEARKKDDHRQYGKNVEETLPHDLNKTEDYIRFLQDIVSSEMKIRKDISITGAHRIGQRESGKIRPISAKFTEFSRPALVRKSAFRRPPISEPSLWGSLFKLEQAKANNKETVSEKDKISLMGDSTDRTREQHHYQTVRDPSRGEEVRRMKIPSKLLDGT